MHLLNPEYLNTSHVLIYHSGNWDYIQHFSNLNTSHVLIYRFYDDLEPKQPKDLNTSHVLIYLEVVAEFDISHRFKYISCSYLSRCESVFRVFTRI